MAKRKKISKLAKQKAKVGSSFWRRKADKAWSELVRGIAGNKCEICGSTDHVQAHHIIDRSVWQLRHCVMNGVSLCPSHHKYDRKMSAHKGSLMFIAWLQTYRATDLRNLISIMESLVAVVEVLGDAGKPDYKTEYENLSVTLPKVK